MTFLDKLKNLFKGKVRPAIAFNTGMTPMYSQYGQNIFQDEVVMQAVGCIVTEMIKLQPKHIRKNGMDLTPQDKTTIQNVLDNPNPLMTQSDFIEKVMWNYFFNSNSFIIPRYYYWKDEKGNEKRYFTGLYPVRPTQVDFLQDGKDEYYIKFYFPNLEPVTFPYGDIIHLRREFSHDDFMGGDESGQPNNKNLRKTLLLNEQILDSVAKSLNASCKINGLLKIKAYLDNEKLKKEIESFNELLENNIAGILPIDSTSDYEDLKKDIKIVDAETLKFVDTKILRNFGVSIPILEGKYTKDEYEAFYQKALEPIIKKLGEAFTKTLFTDRKKSFGNQIIFYTEDLLFLTISQKLELTRL
ncbi:MAG: phage portal protein, partial [Lachnospiraceae bacterium]|nr:phage portal protein [Lachnospiraceae bacterium]